MYGHLPSPTVYPLRYSPTLNYLDTDVHTFVSISVSVAYINHVFTERTVNIQTWVLRDPLTKEWYLCAILEPN